jgi:hypothetical protein
MRSGMASEDPPFPTEAGPGEGISAPSPRRSLRRRCVSLFVLGAGVALGVLGLYFVLGLMAPISPEMRDHLLRTLALNAAFAILLIVAAPRLAPVLPSGPRALERFFARALEGPLTMTAAFASSILLLTWIPHYLTWPWFPDADQFAVSAQSWHAGLLPYRDLPDFDFPGPIYLLYLVGVLFGWGHTAPYYAIDAAFLVLFGFALAAWSRRLFGQALAGLIVYLTFLCAYLSFDYVMVAQRDWHGPLFALLALMALEAIPGRAGRIVSASSMAIALVFRPHVVLFLPAMIAAIDENARRVDGPPSHTIRPLLEWSAAFALALFLVYCPLIIPGVFDDFLARLRIASYGGSYNDATWSSLFAGLRAEFTQPMTLTLLATNLSLAVVGPAAMRKPARTWALALLGSLAYKPISPVPHAYLDQPRALVQIINLAFPIAWILSTPRLIAPIRLAAIAGVFVLTVPHFPTYCSPSRSLAAIRTLARGVDPIEAPAGCERYFRGRDRPDARYRWEDYRRLLAYLRETYPVRIRVANFVRTFPFPTANGPTGHMSTFPAAGGIVHLWCVDPGIEGPFLEALERTSNSIVVWIPDEKVVDPRLKLPRLVRAIERYYHPVARFGDLEVWVRGRLDAP